ncbi:FxsB family cyclophane-forming radical SAM/SPASM peptide maturase [Actinacidiphila oryziradicis]|uniref:FxsB family cyclophane-forming radical SAM/SPASM peptide maturase n=1 Tax=Actinacidiphila oryziradicis TaxID=2571141 RepID=UPI001FEAE452|nr:FxsB family cyclophane-forming radical SAM/SPASM peptide maturase [Actinacidiphila oryziradicis]
MPALSRQEPRTASDTALAPWPLAVLDVPGLRRDGLRPTALRQFILKVHSRCNLSCTYCYIYHAADASWRSHPARATGDTMRRTALRIAEHVDRHRLSEVRVDLHGGEPLMSGPEAVLEYVAEVRAVLPGSCELRTSVQTNGTLLTESGLGELARAGVRVGLSLDGGNAALNHRRVDHTGRPSWPAAERAARLLARHPGTYAGLLCTIDLNADPAEVYTSLAELRPPTADLLLPHANWSHPPPGLPLRAPEAVRTGNPAAAPYGDWLAAVFDLWWDADRSERPHPRIRLFTEIIALLLGLPSTTESVGLSPVAALIVETDGSIEQVDSLKSAYEGATRTGLDVFRHTFDEALDHPGMVARQLGTTALGRACHSCPVLRVCGGGNYAHRYREGSGFRHPSVYCADLERLIRHIATRLAAVVPPLVPPNGRTA